MILSRLAVGLLIASVACVQSTSDDAQVARALVLGRVVTGTGIPYRNAFVAASCSNARVTASASTDSSGSFSMDLEVSGGMVVTAVGRVDCDFRVTTVDLLSFDVTRQIRFGPPSVQAPDTVTLP